MSYHVTGYLGSGAVPGPNGTAFPSIAPYQAFEAADGPLMVVAANDGLFARLCDVIGRPELRRRTSGSAGTRTACGTGPSWPR